MVADKKELVWFVGALLLGAFIMALQIGSPIDDAYVSFVYTRNFVEGNGLVFNLGERVEGYSNFSWVMLLSAFSYAGPIPQVAQVLGFVLGLGCIALTFSLARLCGCGSYAAVAGGLLATDLNFTIWCVEGLETPLYVFSILLTLYFYTKDRSRGFWALPALLAAMTRPEGAAVFGAMAVHRAIVLFKNKKWPDKRDWTAAAIFFIPFIAYNVWRYIYFGGSIFPNTYYARGGGSPITGILYIFFTMWETYGLGIVPLLAIITLGILARGEKDGPLITWIAVGFLLIIATGGDWMPHGRFMAPLMPVMYLAAAKGGQAIEKWRLGLIISIMCVMANVMHVAKYEMTDSFEKRWSRKQNTFYMPVANWLSDHTEPGDPVALSDVGYVTWYSRIRAIDTLGLTDKHLARMPGGSAWATDVDYVLDKKPVYVVSMVNDYSGNELGHTEFDRQIVGHKRFNEEYELAEELAGYEATERSLTDLKIRPYKVIFRIYRRRIHRQ